MLKGTTNYNFGGNMIYNLCLLGELGLSCLNLPNVALHKCQQMPILCPFFNFNKVCHYTKNEPCVRKHTRLIMIFSFA